MPIGSGLLSPSMILVSISRTRNPKSFPAYLSGRVDLGKPPLRYVPESIQRPLSVRVLGLGTGQISLSQHYSTDTIRRAAFTVDESHPPEACTPILYAATEIVFA